MEKETAKETVSKNFIEQIIEKDLAEGKYDEICTRFPPEPNGYLHIGHAKSILLNYGLAQKYHGKFNMRFDDTNPVKEDVEYVNSIMEDVKWLGFDWNEQPRYASDYFDQMYEYAKKLITLGKAYVDDQTGANVYPDNDPAATVDGFVDLENISIDKNGKITGTNKDTGDPVVVGYIALGSVENLNGVLHTEGPYYTAGNAAGDIRVGTPGNSVTGNLRNDKITDGNNVVDPDSALAEGSGATLMTGFLEASGTDLATEFANMIIYQRGYQANTRIVTVTDTMLEELVNMKR